MDSSGWRLARRSVSDDIDGKGADFRRRVDAGAQPLRMIPASSGRRLTKHENVQAGGGAERRGGRLTSALGAIHDARWPLKIGLGLAASLSGVVLRLALEPGAFGHLPYQAFYPGVIAASILGGLLPGVAAAAAGAFWGVLFATPADPAPALRLALFLLNSVAISGLAEAMHRALWRLGEADGRGAEAEQLLIANETISGSTQTAEAIAAFDLDIEKNTAKRRGRASAHIRLRAGNRDQPRYGSERRAEGRRSEDQGGARGGVRPGRRRRSMPPTTGSAGRATGRSAGSPRAARSFSMGRGRFG